MTVPPVIPDFGSISYHSCTSRCSVCSICCYNIDDSEERDRKREKQRETERDTEERERDRERVRERDRERGGKKEKARVGENKGRNH